MTDNISYGTHQFGVFMNILFLGIQDFRAPAVAPLVPIAPARTSQPRPFRPQPFRRPFQPSNFPFQPTLIPFQPALFPFGNQQPSFIPIQDQPQLIPIQIDNGFRQPGFIPDDFFQFRPYGDGFLPNL